MTQELNPVTFQCNLHCTYCYENTNREAGLTKGYNLDLMLSKTTEQFTVFGGEPLLVPIQDLEKIFKYGLEKYKGNGIQTNGTLITDRHIALFKQYSVHVGVSFDGPGELNDARVLGTLTQTRVASLRTETAINQLLGEKVPTSLIITLHRLNGVGERREKLKKWLVALDEQGLQSARLHFLENDGAETLLLSEVESKEAYLDLLQFTRTLKVLKFDIFNEMKQNLMEPGHGSCIWQGCDPYTTSAVHGIDPDGSISNCSRAYKDGVNYRKGDRPFNERQLALYSTPQEDGGCQGCRFFLACKGECPGTGIDGDWRNRTDHCETLKVLFEKLEGELVSEGKEPFTLNNPVRSKMEMAYLSSCGDNTVHVDAHGDSHEDAPHIDTTLLAVLPVGRPK